MIRLRDLLQAARLLALIALFAAGTARAQNLQPDRDYIVLDPPHPVATGSRIEVLEFFYYGCPICYEFQPRLSRYLVNAPDYVAWRRVPVVGSPSYDTFARLFYSLDALGELPRLHWPVYDNYHFDDVKLNEEPVMFDWVARNGIDRDKFIATYNSDTVKKKLDESAELMKTFNVRGVPTVVIDGKYLTSAKLAGGTERLAKVVEQLVQQARRERPN